MLCHNLKGIVGLGILTVRYCNRVFSKAPKCGMPRETKLDPRTPLTFSVKEKMVAPRANVVSEPMS